MCLITGVLFGIYVGLANKESLHANIMFSSILVGSILGTLLGFFLLRIFNKVVLNYNGNLLKKG
jgi:hypothetical protein